MNLADIKNIPLLPFKFRMIIIAIICLIAFCLLYYFEISYVMSKLDTVRSNEASLKEQYSAAITKQVNQQASLANYPEIKRQYEEWQTKFINNDALLELLNDILKIGAKNRITFNNFDPGDQIADGPYFKVPIHITVVGEYHDFASFISQIANMPWVIAVRKFTINRTSEASDKGSLIADLTMEVYKKKEATTDAP